MDTRMEAELRTANQRMVEMAVYMARNDATPASPLIEQLRDELIELDESAIVLLSRRPCLLADFRFDDEPLWQRMLTGEDVAPALWTSSFPRGAAVELAQQVLSLAWHLSGSRIPKASIRLGLSVRVAEMVSRVRLEELMRIAEVHVGALRPRWEARVAFWKRLLDAARSGNLKELGKIDLHGAQLLIRDLTLRVG